MWAQTVPLFQLSGRFAAVLPSVYKGATEAGVTTMDLYSKAIELYSNPCSNEVFKGTRDYEEAMARADI